MRVPQWPKTSSSSKLPRKTKTINKFIGSDYVVKASVGHVRDLVKNDMGVDQRLRADLRGPRGQEEGGQEAARTPRRRPTIVYIASDPDREGEAIGWHIAEILGKDAKNVRRVTFNEITKSAVLKAIEQPGEIDMKKVNAQQARRVLDRLVGYQLSPLLWDKVSRGSPPAACSRWR